MKWLARIFGRSGERDAAPVPPFPVAWRQLLESRVPFFNRLPPEDRGTLQSDIQRFVAGKQFIGTDGLTVSDEMKVVIAAYACLLVLKRPDFGLYRCTNEIIVRPGEFGDVTTAIGPDGIRYDIYSDRIGEAWYRGPIVLAWDSIARRTRSRHSRHNVIIHEFAHKLDFLNGLIDGTPPLDSRGQLADWVRVFTREYETLKTQAWAGGPSFLDQYGATSPAEFFAVASEVFFEIPRELRKLHAELYAELSEFYRQDPAAWPE
jgi:Mlc titration factor MtfA (ptsG expression regulator)